MRFSKEVQEAHRWFRNGDHPDDESEWRDLEVHDGNVAQAHLTEGKVVRYFRHPDKDGSELHDRCGSPWDNHGWIEQNDQTVCPGNWVTTTDDGYMVVEDTPFQDAMIISEAKDVQTVATHGDDQTIRVIFYADCRHHKRRRFHERGPRDEWAQQHFAATRHAVDTYEVER